MMRVIALCACSLLAGCGTHGLKPGVAAAGPGTPGTTVTEAQRAAEGGVVLTDNPSIVNGRPLHFDSWSRGSSDDVVSVHFTIGSPDCTGVHATVAQTPETVILALRSGTLPEAVGRMCTMIAVFATPDVALQAPVGDRTVLSVS